MAAKTVPSSTKPMAFGNILFGSATGVGVDVATGAAYDYPTVISLDLGAPILAPAAMLPAAFVILASTAGVPRRAASPRATGPGPG